MTETPRPTWPSPWGSSEPRAPRRRTLSREGIVETALAIVDAEGLDALSMRRVSQELNTGPASLYAHVGSKEQLIELLLDRVAADVVLPVPDPVRWREQVKEFLTRAKDNMVAHNDLAKAGMIANIPMLPHQLDIAEALIALLKAGGLPDQVIAYTTDLLALYVVSSAYEESQRSGPDAAPEEARAYMDSVRAYFASLPPERYPTLLTMIGPMTRSVRDERWEFGLDAILAGVEHVAARTAAGQAERRSSEAR